MSLLDSLSGLGGGQSEAGGSHAAVAQALVQEADQHPGGFAGLLDQFKQNGLGQHVNSWTSSQQNQTLTADQVQQGAGPGVINSIAERAGISPTVAKVALAAMLPVLVSHLSQNGQQQLPGQGGLGSLVGGMGGVGGLLSKIL